MQRHTAAIATYSKRTVLVLAIVTAGSLVFGAARAQQSNAQGQATSLADNLHQNFIIQHEIGHRFHIDPANLPAPKTTVSGAGHRINKDAPVCKTFADGEDTASPAVFAPNSNRLVAGSNPARGAKH